MRELVLDTETTGFDPESGDRIVEIGVVELVDHLPSGETYHVYINPERKMPQGAFEVHGLGDEFLADKPTFKQIADDFLKFVGRDKMIIHNANFDMKFLNAELKWLKKPPLPMSQALDTLDMARKKFPGAQNSLDALCRRFGVNNAGRTLHGALLDSELLAEVYLELIGGRQPDLGFGAEPKKQKTITTTCVAAARPRALPSRLTDAERETHTEFLAMLKDSKWGAH